MWAGEKLGYFVSSSILRPEFLGYADPNGSSSGDASFMVKQSSAIAGGTWTGPLCAPKIGREQRRRCKSQSLTLFSSQLAAAENGNNSVSEETAEIGMGNETNYLNLIN